MRRGSALVPLLAGLLAVVPVAASAAPHAGHYRYSRVRLPTAGNPHRVATEIAGVTATGEVVGSVSGPGPNGSRAFIKAPGGQLTWLHVKGFASALVDAVSERGLVVFTVFKPRGENTRLYLRQTDGTLKRIRIPGLDPSGVVVSGVNDAGDVVGGGFTVSGKPKSFVDRSGHVHVLTVPFAHASATYAAGINDAGVIVGSYANHRGRIYGFIDRAGKVRSINLPRAGQQIGRGSAIQAISDNGIWVGQATTDSSAATVILYLHVPGHPLVRLHYPKPGAQTFAMNVNSAGIVTGSYEKGRGPTFGFIARPTK